MKEKSKKLRLLFMVTLPMFLSFSPLPAPSPVGPVSTYAQSSDPCRPISGTQSTSGNCVTTSYMLACDGPGGTLEGGALFACTSSGCDLGGGGFSMSVTCRRIHPGFFIDPIML